MAKWPITLAKCHDGTGAGRTDARQTDQIRHSREVDVDGVWQGYPLSFGRNPAKAEMRNQPSEEGRAKPRDPPEPRNSAERPMALAIRHNAVGQGRAEPRESPQLRRSGTVNVNPLRDAQRLLLQADGITMSDRVAITPGIEELGSYRWRTRSGGRRAEQVPDKHQGEENAEGSAFAAGDGGEEVFHPGEDR